MMFKYGHKAKDDIPAIGLVLMMLMKKWFLSSII
jgi:hypothetical protein